MIYISLSYSKHYYEELYIKKHGYFKFKNFVFGIPELIFVQRVAELEKKKV